MLVVQDFQHHFHLMMLEGTPRKDGLFLLNVVCVDLVSLRRNSWCFCLVVRLVHQSSRKSCPNYSLWLSEKMLAFSFNIWLDLYSFIKTLRTDKRLLYVLFLNICRSIIIVRLLSKFFKFT